MLEKRTGSYFLALPLSHTSKVRATIAILITLFISFELIIPGDLSELNKLPALYTHFKQHQKKDPGISLIDFLELHYTNPAHHNGDHHETHNQLPFAGHHHHNCFLHQLLFTLPDTDATLTIVNEPSIKNSFYTIPEGITFINSIWQPPRRS